MKATTIQLPKTKLRRRRRRRTTNHATAFRPSSYNNSNLAGCDNNDDLPPQVLDNDSIFAWNSAAFELTECILVGPFFFATLKVSENIEAKRRAVTEPSRIMSILWQHLERHASLFKISVDNIRETPTISDQPADSRTRIEKDMGSFSRFQQLEAFVFLSKDNPAFTTSATLPRSARRLSARRLSAQDSRLNDFRLDDSRLSDSRLDDSRLSDSRLKTLGSTTLGSRLSNANDFMHHPSVSSARPALPTFCMTLLSVFGFYLFHFLCFIFLCFIS